MKVNFQFLLAGVYFFRHFNFILYLNLFKFNLMHYDKCLNKICLDTTRNDILSTLLFFEATNIILLSLQMVINAGIGAESKMITV